MGSSKSLPVVSWDHCFELKSVRSTGRNEVILFPALLITPDAILVLISLHFAKERKTATSLAISAASSPFWVEFLLMGKVI